MKTIQAAIGIGALGIAAVAFSGCAVEMAEPGEESIGESSEELAAGCTTIKNNLLAELAMVFVLESGKIDFHNHFVKVTPTSGLPYIRLKNDSAFTYCLNSDASRCPKLKYMLNLQHQGPFNKDNIRTWYVNAWTGSKNNNDSAFSEEAEFFFVKWTNPPAGSICGGPEVVFDQENRPWALSPCDHVREFLRAVADGSTSTGLPTNPLVISDAYLELAEGYADHGCVDVQTIGFQTGVSAARAMFAFDPLNTQTDPGGVRTGNSGSCTSQCNDCNVNGTAGKCLKNSAGALYCSTVCLDQKAQYCYTTGRC